MATVVLKNVKKIYGGKVVAVHDFNLDIADKEFIVFVGPSGCGKSTTLRMIAGLEDISEGTIEIDGVEVNDLQPKDRDIAMVFQNYALYPHMSVYDNIAFSLRLRKMPEDQVYEKVTNAAEILGITDYLLRKPRELSGGQRQRVAIARALALEPDLLVLDEPTSSLDRSLQFQILRLLAGRQAARSMACLFITHDLRLVRSFCHRVLVLRQGVCVEQAPAAELFAAPRSEYTRVLLKAAMEAAGEHPS